MESKGGWIDEEEDVERGGGKGYSEGEEEGVGVIGEALATHKLGK